MTAASETALEFVERALKTADEMATALHFKSRMRGDSLDVQQAYLHDLMVVREGMEAMKTLRRLTSLTPSDSNQEVGE